MKAKGIFDGYTEEFVKEPVLKEWKVPEFYRTDYHYTEKRIAKEKAKEDERLRKEYDNEVEEINTYKESVQKIIDCPERLADFFADSIKGFVDRTREHRAMLEKRRDELYAWFRRDFAFTFQTERGESVTITRKVVDDVYYFYGLYDSSTKGCRPREEGHDHNWDKFNAAFPTDEGKAEFFAKYDERKKVDAELSNTERASDAYFRLVSNIGGHGGIIDKMVAVLGGMPDHVDFDSDWGVGGYYNGIVAREGKRASFKSFYAGGWNIQRLHIRFKVTLLKD